MAKIDGIDDDKAEILVKSGFLSVEGIVASEVSDVAETTGLDEEEARKICEAVTAAQADVPEEPATPEEGEE